MYSSDSKSRARPSMWTQESKSQIVDAPLTSAVGDLEP